LQQTVAGGAGKLRNVLSLTDASTKLLRFVFDDVWGSKGVCRLVSRSIATYLVNAIQVNVKVAVAVQIFIFEIVKVKLSLPSRKLGLISSNSIFLSRSGRTIKHQM
jgi:hypothetical protein